MPKTTQEYFPITIEFGINNIIVCEENTNSISCLKELFDNPNEYHFKTIMFQQKEYEVLPEVLFALFINEFKKKIEKEFIIKETVLKVQTKEKKIIERLIISLNAIGLQIKEKKETKKEKEITDIYQLQGEILREIIEKNEITLKYSKMIIEAQKRENENTMTEEEKKIMKESMGMTMTEEKFRSQMMKIKPIERTRMNLYHLDNYCIFIASRYFETIEDHINLTFVSKRMRGNMEKFHYNPIAVTSKTLKFFPNTETLHRYDEE